MLSTKPEERLVRSYDTVRQEVDQELEIAEGKIPEDLRGFCFETGPAAWKEEGSSTGIRSTETACSPGLRLPGRAFGIGTGS